jgi:hypothetical protein
MLGVPPTESGGRIVQPFDKIIAKTFDVTILL